MSCIHCDHCRQVERNKQANADLHPNGTHLTHPTHGRVVYWRADIDLDGTPRAGHYVYRAGDPDRELFYVHGNDFQLAQVEVDVPYMVEVWMAEDAQTDEHGWWAGNADRQALRAALRDGNRLGRGRSASRRITATHAALTELRSLAYFVRDTANVSRATIAASERLIERVNAVLT